MVREASDATGTQGTPGLSEARGAGEAPSATERRPTTTNPAAEGLRYVPAEEARAALARLAVERTSADGSFVLNLSDAFREGQRSGRELRSAEDDYLISAIGVLVQRHLWGPRFFNDTSATLDGFGDEGSFQHAASLVNTLKATQRLPYGGEVEAAWVVRATEQLREQATGRYTQSSELVLSASIPLLRGAGQVAQEDLLQAERDLIYQARTFERFRRSFLVSIAGDYFDLVQSAAQIRNQEVQIESLRRLEAATKARVEAGRLDAFQTGIATSRVLAGEARLRGLRETYALQLDRFKVRLGFGPDKAVAIGDIDLSIPEPAISPEDATRIALEYRLDLQNQRDRVGDAARTVANRRDALLPDLKFTGSVGVPTDTDERVGSLSHDAGETEYSVGLMLSMPLDRERERLDLRSSMIRLGQSRRDYEKSRDDVIVRVRSALRNIDVAKFQLDLAEQQVKINERRVEGQTLKKDQLDPQILVDTANELLDAQNNRDQARTDLRKAILNYLLESDQLRVARDGTFERLPGM
jgi:outer membrane protein TolC